MTASKSLTYADIKKAIIASLTPDLLDKKWRTVVREGDPRETGHCAVASEAFYHLAGGKEAGFMPVVCVFYFSQDDTGRIVFEKQQGYAKGTHWWIKGPQNGVRGAGKIFDVTAAQMPEDFPYERGHHVGFMQPQQKPSKRAKVVIDRVVEKLGAGPLAAFRHANISAYRRAGAKKDNTCPLRVL